jgi:outer membrane biosynthesis protein TonB
MKPNSKHSNHDILKYLRYFSNHLSGKERYDFEKKIMQDRFEEEAFDGLSQLNYDELREDLSELESRLKGRGHVRNVLLLPVFRYAVAAMLILGTGTIIYLLNRTVRQSTRLAEAIQSDTLNRKALNITTIDTSKHIIAQERAKSVKPKVNKAPSEAPDLYKMITDEEIVPQENAAIPEKETEYAEVGTPALSTENDTGKREKKKQYQQFATVKGKILSAEDNTPLPGVNIVIGGTATGTVSDADGNFSIKVPDTEETILQLALIGYETKEVEVTGNKPVDITMNPSLIALDDVVVIGYGTQKRSDVTGSVVSVPTDSLPAVNRALQGKAAGVNVTVEGQTPGSESVIHGRDASVNATDVYTVEGKVIDASDNSPLPGVNIFIKGSSLGTITDTEGKFTLEVPVNTEPVLEFSFLGYTTEEVRTNGNEEIEVSMNEDLLALDEVVIVGYGIQKKADQTGAISNVRLKEEHEAAPLIIHPKPEDGMKAFRNYVRRNIHYNRLPSYDKPVSVKLEFTIGIKGDISNIRIKKSAGTDFDKEAIRLIREGPAWTPATQDGKPITYDITLKIKFDPPGKQ